MLRVLKNMNTLQSVTVWLAYAVWYASPSEGGARSAVETVMVLCTACLGAYPFTLQAVLVSLRLDDHVYYTHEAPSGG